MGLVEDTSAGRLIFHVMHALAEFERGIIVERTQKGKSLAKQEPNFRKGRPNMYSKKQIVHKRNAYVQTSGSQNRYI